MNQMNNQRFGAVGEKYAAEYLKKQHYIILKRNYRNKLGEIDIIARDGEEVVFVEVKTRSAAPYLSGQYAVDKRKQFRIMRAASHYLEGSRCTLQPRFDVIEVEIDRTTRRLKGVEHYKNAFSQTEDYARF